MAIKETQFDFVWECTECHCEFSRRVPYCPICEENSRKPESEQTPPHKKLNPDPFPPTHGW